MKRISLEQIAGLNVKASRIADCRNCYKGGHCDNKDTCNRFITALNKVLKKDNG